MRKICLTAICVLVCISFVGCGLCHKKPVVWTPGVVGPSGTPDKAFNLVWKTSDLNGLPHNPLWGAQIPTSSKLPPPPTPKDCVREPDGLPCTDQKTAQDTPGFPNIAICGVILASHIHGHVNWMPAEYTGALAWWNFADDWDYNFALVPGDYQGLTAYNNELGSSAARRFIELEFDSREASDRFGTEWWRNFHGAVEKFDDQATQMLLSPDDPNRLPQAVAVGLFGLDCEHDCRSELHPLYGIAIETQDRPDDNVWAIYVRNWGNEGFCSQYEHQVDFTGNRITLFLPRQSTGIFTIDRQRTKFAAAAGIEFPSIAQVKGKGTAVTFTLPPAAQHGTAELILHLTWEHDNYPRPRVEMKNLFAAAGQRQAVRPEAARESEAEGYLGKLYRQKKNAPPQKAVQRAAPAAALERNLQAQAPASFQSAVTTPDEAKLQQSPSLPGTSRRVDERKLVRDCEFIRDICSSYDNKPPTDVVKDFPQLCEQLKEENACVAAAARARQ